MGKIEKTLTLLHSLEEGGKGGEKLHPLCMLGVTLVYLTAMLSVPSGALAMLLWFALYPVVMSAIAGEDFSRIFLMSLVALPFALLIGLFNPIYDRETAFTVGSVAVSRGWVSYLAIIVRSVLSVQALLLLTGAGGFPGLCRSLERIGVPTFLTTQLMMVYRYLTVLLQESLEMNRARQARGYGKRHLGLKMWGAFCGQLFLRTVNRAETIHRAMLARGFTGRMPRGLSAGRRWRLTDTLTLIIATGVFALMRFADLSRIFF